MPKIIITWVALHDRKTCLICKDIDGYQWVFEAGKDFMTDALWHPVHGIVWSLSEGSNAHAPGYLSGHIYNCRCELKEDFDLEDILAKCIFLRELVQSQSEPYIPWRGGGYFAGGT